MYLVLAEAFIKWTQNLCSSDQTMTAFHVVTTNTDQVNWKLRPPSHLVAAWQAPPTLSPTVTGIRSSVGSHLTMSFVSNKNCFLYVAPYAAVETILLHLFYSIINIKYICLFWSILQPATGGRRSHTLQALRHLVVKHRCPPLPVRLGGFPVLVLSSGSDSVASIW